MNLNRKPEHSSPSKELIDVTESTSTAQPLPGENRARVLIPDKLPPNLNAIETRKAVILLIAQGSTIRKVITELAIRTEVEFPEEKIFALFRQYADDIDQARQEYAELVMSAGLVRKETRLMKISELAESWEGKAHVEPKAAAIYLKALEQINKETEHLDIPVLAPNDPWLCMLQDLQNLQVQSLKDPESTMDQQESRSTSNSKPSELPPSVTNNNQ